MFLIQSDRTSNIFQITKIGLSYFSQIIHCEFRPSLMGDKQSIHAMSRLHLLRHCCDSCLEFPDLVTWFLCALKYPLRRLSERLSAAVGWLTPVLNDSLALKADSVSQPHVVYAFGWIYILFVTLNISHPSMYNNRSFCLTLMESFDIFENNLKLQVVFFTLTHI